MPRSLRYLRISWTAICGIACVLLLVLWVRSNYWIDQITLPVTQSRYVAFGSVPNAFMFGSTNVRPPVNWGSGPADEWLANALEREDLPWSAAPKFRIIGLALYRQQSSPSHPGYACLIDLASVLCYSPRRW
jgi:hypothetical protein